MREGQLTDRFLTRLVMVSTLIGFILGENIIDDTVGLISVRVRCFRVCISLVEVNQANNCLIHFYKRMFEFSESDDSDFDETPTENCQSSPPKVSGVKHLNEIRDILELTKYQKKKLKKIRKRKEAKARKLCGRGEGIIIQTLAAKSKANGVIPEVVTFVDHKNRKKKVEDKIIPDNIPLVSKDTREEISMKQARFEVFKLGVSAMDKKDQVDANTALAIRLGAKPAKNEAMEYHKLKEKRLQEKEEQRRKLEDDRNNLQAMKQRKKGPKEKGKAKSKKQKGEQMKVGSFDGGMLKLSAKDLSRLKGK